MTILRKSPSGFQTSRIILSGTTIIPAGQQLAFGPTPTRVNQERVWVHVFPVTPAQAPNDYLVVSFAGKQVGNAIDEWTVALFDVVGPQPFDRVIDWTAFGVIPRGAGFP